MKKPARTTGATQGRFILPSRSLLLALGVSIVLASLYLTYTHSRTSEPFANTAAEPTERLEQTPFPVSVDPERKIISDNSLVDTYYIDHVAVRNGSDGAHTSWFGKVLGKLALSAWYQNLASLSTRTLVIQSGERKEEIAHNFATILKWDDSEKQNFLSYIETTEPFLTEGKFFPGVYVVARDAAPETVAALVNERFTQEVVYRYTDDVAALVPFEDTLIIASLLEREAYDFTDMRDISGIIWNRLFIDMPLQLDASLQYAKGTESNTTWWPRVRPADKYIESDFNTYANKGLPPAPIANPSLDAIVAALNPNKTECMYYFHDRRGGFHCSETYEKHVELLIRYYGQGR